MSAWWKSANSESFWVADQWGIIVSSAVKFGTLRWAIFSVYANTCVVYYIVCVGGENVTLSDIIGPRLLLIGGSTNLTTPNVVR